MDLKLNFKRMRIVILIIPLLIFQGLFAQENQVANPSFEQHRPIQCIGCSGQAAFSSFVKNWQNTGFYCQLYSSHYTFSTSELERGFSVEKYAPQHGKASICLPVYPMDSRGSVVGGGSAGYIYAPLKKPLLQDTLYSVSFWVKILNNFDATDVKTFQFLQNMGITFSANALFENDENIELIYSDSPFLLDTLVAQKWVKVQHIICPTEQLNYVLLGWLQNPNSPPYLSNQHGISRFEFLVDDIQIKAIAKPTVAQQKAAIPYPFVNTPKISKTPEVIDFEGLTIYFSSNSSALDSIAQKTIDAIIPTFTIHRNAIFHLTGHTDNVGHEVQNLALSQARAEAVKAYILAKNSRLSSHQFITKGVGNAAAVNANQNEAERQQNRRVNIKKSNYSLPQYWYQRASVNALNQQADSAFFYLQNWMKHAETDKLLLLFDPDLTHLQTQKEWNAIESFIKKSYEKYDYPSLAFQLDSLYIVDEFYREMPDKYAAAKGFKPKELDLTFAQLKEKWQAATSLQDAQIASILDKNGYPNPTNVGKRAAHAPVHVLIHSRNISFQKKYLPMAKKAMENGHIEAKWYAMLYDKIQVQEHGTQVYGTQFEPSVDEPLLYRLVPLQYPEQVNELRAEIGLPPFGLREFWVKE